MDGWMEMVLFYSILSYPILFTLPYLIRGMEWNGMDGFLCVCLTKEWNGMPGYSTHMGTLGHRYIHTYLTLSYLTLPYLTLPYLTLPYITLPYLPYLTVHYMVLACLLHTYIHA